MSNPALRSSVFVGQKKTQTTMSLQGTILKTSFLLLFTIGSAVWIIGELGQSSLDPQTLQGLLGASALGGLIVGFITIFFPRAAMVTAPLYALLQGVLLGIISYFFELQYPGIVSQALPLTFSLFGSMLILYSTGVVRATQKVKAILMTGFSAYLALILLNWLLRFFAGRSLPIFYSSSPMSILFSVGLIILGTLSFVLDFDFIERQVKRGAPSYMEWYAAFGLLVSLIWLYLRVLEFLAKVQHRNSRR